jgi:SOS-response transcriptional repressor LexA
MARPELTPREKMCYEVIIKYFQENGFAPAMEDIQRQMYYSSPASAQRIIECLEAKGYIDRPKIHTPRALRVIGMQHIMEG